MGAQDKDTDSLTPTELMLSALVDWLLTIICRGVNALVESKVLNQCSALLMPYIIIIIIFKSMT